MNFLPHTEDIMANKFDEEQKALQEKREILKLKQGLIDVEDSDIIEEKRTEPYEELHGMKKVENFFYHYKVPFIVITLAVLAIGYMLFDTITKEKNDLYILAVSTTNESGLYTKQFDIEKALEQYCPDFDGNGYVHVGVNFINLSDQRGSSQYADSENYKFSSELFTGDAQLYLTDEGIMELIAELADGKIEFFVDLSEKYPTDALHDEGYGYQVNTTSFTEAARWSTCPDTVGIYIRDEFDNMTGDPEKINEQRNRALEVLDNIANNKIINPAD